MVSCMVYPLGAYEAGCPTQGDDLRQNSALIAQPSLIDQSSAQINRATKWI